MIQEIMIINKAGIALFYHNFVNVNLIDDHQSLASYFDIICRFTKNSFKESLRMLTLDNFIFFFYTARSNYHLVLKCGNKKIKKELLEDIAESILTAFLTEFKNSLDDFNGEISEFKPFSEIVEGLVSSKLNEYGEPMYIEY
ncbi:MAG: hypothetical protein KGD58_07300 [Candidatus Lokiarchaeota archaeon]|nr:hypothetical protein [Candidatus Lokiarchaeota archaeon]